MLGAIRDGARVHTFRSERVVIDRSKPGLVHIDGDPAHMGQRLVVRCHTGGLGVFSPGEIKVKPVFTPLGIK